MTDETYYLTTPIYYVNATPHLGHAYTTILADTMARFQRLRLGSERVYFLTGTDEHGDKVAQAAAKAGESPQAYADRISGIFRDTWEQLGLTPNQFIRTTSEHHKRTVQRFLQQIYDSGDIYFGEYGGQYCFGCERFYTEKELQDGKCPDHQTAPTFIKEENYFFRMGKYQDWLIGYINDHPDFIRPERYKNEVLSFLKDPLEDLCISRPRARLEWGIPIPFDERFVTYVWFDALINYISALDWPKGKDFRRFWPAAQHLIAKDILKPHAIYWPTMLKAAGIEPYRHLNVHGYWKIEEAKMSKSLGRVVRPLDLADTYGVDVFRYFLLREMTFGLDATFSEDALVARLNADLANDLGNLFSRVLKLVEQYYGGNIAGSTYSETFSDATGAALTEIMVAMERFAFSEALGAIWNLVSATNKYLVTNEPWKQEPGNPRTKAVLFTAAETLRRIAVLLLPFMPETADRMLQGLGIVAAPTSIPGGLRELLCQTPIVGLRALFPRVETAKPTRPQKARKSSEVVEASTDQITIEEFRRLDLRVAEVVEAEAVPGSKKLVRLRVRLKDEERIIVAGLREQYPPESWPGKQVILVANLKPTTLMGVQSQGMVLAAEDDEGKIVLLMPEQPIPPGSKIR
ncbi:MAG: methionine--tRNA ligase [Candidatus Methylomirabilis oxyfera]|nr:methionine--tRNA ligase [Candidatus Methylomirabilis oxyfera]